MHEPATIPPSTAEEVIARYQRRMRDLPALEMQQDAKGRSLGTTHPDDLVGQDLILRQIGVDDPAFYHPFMLLLLEACAGGAEPDMMRANFVLAAVRESCPRDALEAMLAAQMAVLHIAQMQAAGRLAQAQHLAQIDAATRGLNTLSRTYAAQMEALKRYRSKGEQKVTVQHVTVEDGGQALVGAVSAGGRGT